MLLVDRAMFLWIINVKSGWHINDVIGSNAHLLICLPFFLLTGILNRASVSYSMDPYRSFWILWNNIILLTVTVKCSATYWISFELGVLFCRRTFLSLHYSLKRRDSTIFLHWIELCRIIKCRTVAEATAGIPSFFKEDSRRTAKDRWILKELDLRKPNLKDNVKISDSINASLSVFL